MISRRFAAVAAAILLVPASLLALAPAALAKGDVQARLDAAISKDAKPGSTVTVGWTLAALEGSEWQPFGAEGTSIFIRLVGGSAGSETEARAVGDGTGHFTARVAIPKGGVADVQIGIHGTCTGTGCTGNGDDLFRIGGVGSPPAVVPADELTATIDPLPPLGPPYTAVDVTVHVALRPGIALAGRVLPGSVVVRARDVDLNLATYAEAGAIGSGAYRTELALPAARALEIEAGIGGQQGITSLLTSSPTVLRLSAAAVRSGAGAGAPAAAANPTPVAPVGTSAAQPVLPVALAGIAAIAVVVLGLFLARRSSRDTARV